MNYVLDVFLIQKNHRIYYFGWFNSFLCRKKSFFFLVLISSVRYKQRGHIADHLVEHHRQSPLGKAKAGAAVGAFPPKDEKNQNIRTTPHDFK